MNHNLVTVGLKDPLMVDGSLAMTTRSMARILPSSANVWNPIVPILDQGPWGSCTAFSVRYAYLIEKAKTGPIVEPSTAFWYAKARLITPGRTPIQDTGSTLSALTRVVSTIGTVPEPTWPYSSANVFSLPNVSPSAASKMNMRKLTISNTPAQNLTTLKTAIADGKAVIISVLVYSSFMTLTVFTTGRVPTPKRNETLLGGHAICLTGYDDATRTFSFVNSWGTYTGIGGRYTITYDYVSSPNYAGEYFSF